jgi:cupin 2 domain-containing protein
VSPGTGNLFAHLPAKLTAEQIEIIAQSAHVKVERIVSTGHTTPPGEWYDQDTNEWVVVLRGRARLRFEDEREARVLAAGDHVTIAAHRRHRVEWTDPSEPTVWLAVHD